MVYLPQASVSPLLSSQWNASHAEGPGTKQPTHPPDAAVFVPEFRMPRTAHPWT